MRIIHFSDTHLGFSDFTKVDPETGINLREADVYDAFSQVINYIISNPPDIVIHAGDLFDTYRPPNRAINFALKEIARVSQKQIPVIMISGNHSTPRIRISGSIFEAFEILENVYPVYQSKYQEIIIKDVAVHCVPHMGTEEELNRAFDEIRINTKVKYNVIVAHLGITAEVQYKMGEFNELIIPQGALKKKSELDYIALGHYHRNLVLAENCCYSGSTERFSFNEAGQPKGFMEVDLAAKKRMFIPIKVREMIAFDPIDCKDQSSAKIVEEIEQLIKDRTQGNILQITFANIRRQQYLEMNFSKIKEIVSDAVHLKIICNWMTEKGSEVTKTSIGALSSEFESFIAHQDIKDLDKKKLKELGVGYLSQAQEEEE
ncbi:MAG: exonuclease SbcCD subunit D [Candidatus Omnitrophica bacterium]|nr:exonuclease SbcCD subunit D [Candidatus Omnitrophota bacterium]